MITHRNITGVVGSLMAAAVLACFVVMAFPQKAVETLGGNAIAMEYESELFDTDQIIQIDIQMEEADWEEMLAEAMAEEYYACDVVINGRKICNVGIRPKGNTSLSSIVSDPDTDRFSLKLEFDHYTKGQTCFGLDKLILNNNYADATNMKEAIVYDMYQYLGADASLYNYAEISVNGVYWGVYLALEAVEESFLLRNYGTEDGELYKPENMDGERNGQERPEGEAPFGGGMPEPPEEGAPFGGGMPEPPEEGAPFGGGMPEPPEEGTPFGGGMPEPPEEGAPFGNGMPGEGISGGGMPGGGFSKDNGGADLNYTDDALESYSVIWDGEVTDAADQDHRRVVTALKNISEGTDLENYLDVDNVLKYMAVHTFSVNMDSLSGNMTHNYYLYEYNGQLNILPWDYNLAFGGMGAGMGGAGRGQQGQDTGASAVINDAVDTPFQGTEFFDALLENEEYLSRYHEYLRQLTEEYVFGGKFEETYLRIRSRIDVLVQNDPTAFYSCEQYEAGAAMLYQTVMLRAESIQGQIDGMIPSTDEGQMADDSDLVDASEIDVNVMGSFDKGRK